MTTFIKIGATEYNAAHYAKPAERTFREGWEMIEGTGVISVNMTKAKDIWRNKIRQARIEPLANLDADFMKALETGADTSDIVSQKQALRDAPALAAIDEATNVAQLTAVQPIPNYTIDQIIEDTSPDPDQTEYVKV